MLFRSDTTTVPGVCSPCPSGYSSIDGGICAKCPVGYDSDAGGLCRPCAPGWSSVSGKLCAPCPAGFSSFAGGSCFACPAGQFSYSGGNCTNCPSSFSSTQGSAGCYACGFGQTSNAGGRCIDRCPDGQSWNQAFQLCVVCPVNTFALSGSTSCTRCPYGHFAPDGGAICFPQDRVGGVLRIDVPFTQVDEEQVVRALANLLDSEMSWFNVHMVRPGSTVFYFSISDPSAADLTADASAVRKLSGNEKMLLFYQWWVMGDSRIDDLPFDLLDLKEFALDPTSATNVIPLFAPSSAPPEAIIPPQIFFTSNRGLTLISQVNVGANPAEVQVALQVGASSKLVSSIVLLVATMLLAVILSM